ncbi:MAG TPA: hypothetical protein VFS55_08850 [Dokdonella sp.]|nr:hypothetical protein [Dokdonella sp.]
MGETVRERRMRAHVNEVMRRCDRRAAASATLKRSQTGRGARSPAFIRSLLSRVGDVRIRASRRATGRSTQMIDDKVQGEGDYESAHRYQKETERFVKEHTKGGRAIKGSAEEATDGPTPEEREGLSHARPGDVQDAEVMRNLEDGAPRGDASR